ncbi:MAG: hypothetical protein IKQ40_07020 [Lachnospiraceae bacterium]|nr:hypothetical protein [Lachnospiraceae bacterium]
MTHAVIYGLILLVVAVTSTILIFKYTKIGPDDRLGVILLACAAITVAGVLFRVGELPGERARRAKKCLENGYSVDLQGHAIFSGSVDLDLFTVKRIDDEHETVLILVNENSPEWAREYND